MCHKKIKYIIISKWRDWQLQQLFVVSTIIIILPIFTLPLFLISPWSTIFVIYHFCDLPFLWSTIFVIYHFCDLPFLWSTIFVIYHFCDLPFLWSTIFVIYHFCDLPFFSLYLMWILGRYQTSWILSLL